MNLTEKSSKSNIEHQFESKQSKMNMKVHAENMDIFLCETSKLYKKLFP